MTNPRFLLSTGAVAPKKPGVIGWIADEDGDWDCGDCGTCSAYGTKDCLSPELDGLYFNTVSSIARIIEDAQDNGFVITCDDDDLYIMKHCPECHGNAMMTFIQIDSERLVHRCRCGHKAWA